MTLSHGWTRSVVAVLVLATLAVLAGQALADEARDKELAELRERFKQRYPDLARLRDAQKVGETPTGLTSVPDRSLLNDPISDADDAPTIGQFLAAENKDRKRLYQLLAEELEVSVATVAKHNAQRNFDEAKPHHYLRDTDGQWLTKKDWLEKHADDG